MSNNMSLKGTSLCYSKNGKIGITNITLNAEEPIMSSNNTVFVYVHQFYLQN